MKRKYNPFVTPVADVPENEYSHGKLTEYFISSGNGCIGLYMYQIKG